MRIPVRPYAGRGLPRSRFHGLKRGFEAVGRGRLDPRPTRGVRLLGAAGVGSQDVVATGLNWIAPSRVYATSATSRAAPPKREDRWRTPFSCSGGWTEDPGI